MNAQGSGGPRRFEEAAVLKVFLELGHELQFDLTAKASALCLHTYRHNALCMYVCTVLNTTCQVIRVVYSTKIYYLVRLMCMRTGRTLPCSS